MKLDSYNQGLVNSWAALVHNTLIKMGSAQRENCGIDNTFDTAPHSVLIALYENDVEELNRISELFMKYTDNENRSDCV